MFLSDVSLRNSGHDDGHWSWGTLTSQYGKGSPPVVDKVEPVISESRSDSFSMVVTASVDMAVGCVRSSGGRGTYVI